LRVPPRLDSFLMRPTILTRPRYECDTESASYLASTCWCSNFAATSWLSVAATSWCCVAATVVATAEQFAKQTTDWAFAWWAANRSFVASATTTHV